jgi:multidrug resistance protein MdtO
MVVATEVLSPLHRPGLLLWLRRELAPTPGRSVMTLRLVVTVAIVTIISMALQTPETGLSCFMVLFVTKENRVVTTVTAVLLILAATLGIGASLFLFRFTFDYPQLRIVAIALALFIGMYLSRVFEIGPLGFALGFVLSITQNMGELAPTPDLLVRALLWTWVALVFPIATTVVVNQLLLPSNPWAALTRGLKQRLDAAGSVLQRVIDDGLAGGKRNASLVEMATRGSAPLLAELKFAEMKEAHLKGRHNSLTATIVASEHVMNASALLEMRTPQPLSESDRLCAKALLAEIACLRTAVAEKNPVLPLNDLPVPTLPELHELRFALALFHRNLVEETPVPAAPKKEKKSMFAADALTNLAHVRFAFKVTLAAMTCYFIYTGLDWPGIHTAFITSCFIALENTGASMRKGWLRLGGCALGGLLGFLAIMYLVPHMESIVSLVLLVSAVTALAGWVVAGSERISYGGLQFGFAFYFCAIQGFAPGTDFDTIRDRLVGIALGILVSTAVFHFIWPESAMSQLRAALARALRHLAQFLLIPGSGVPSEAERKAAADLRGKLTKDLDSTLRLSELTMFEAGETDGPPELSPLSLQAIAEHAQAACLVGTALSTETELAEWQRLGQPAQEAETALRTSAAKRLEGIATFVESGRRSESDNFESAVANWKRATVQITGNDRSRLLRALVEQITSRDGLQARG